jgi:hypothetical protein
MILNVIKQLRRLKMVNIDSTFADEILRQGMGYLDSLLRTFEPLEQAIFNLLMKSKTALTVKAIRRRLIIDFIKYLGTGGTPPHLAPLYDFLPTNPEWHEKFRNLVKREVVKKSLRDIFEDRPIGVLDQQEMKLYEKLSRAHGFILPGFRRVKECAENLKVLGFIIGRQRYERGDIYSVHPRITTAVKKHENNKVFNKVSEGNQHGQKEKKKIKGQVLDR